MAVSTPLKPLIVAAFLTGITVVCAIVLTPQLSAETTLPEAKIRSRLEALSRINPSLYSRSTRIQQLVNETAKALYGDPRLVDLVRQFNLTGHNTALLEIARITPEDPPATAAVEYLLNGNDANTTFTPAALEDPVILSLLSRNGSAKALSFLRPQLISEDTEPTLRASLVSKLCLKKQSARLLLELLKSLESPAKLDLVRAAVTALNQTPWADIKSDFKTLLPNNQDLSPEESWDIKQLVEQTGNIDQGQQVFRTPEFTCVNCHQIGDVGKDIGPALTEIGKKLGKDALFDAILNPSAGISFDYEGWNITLNSGDELTGMVLSKTDTHWTLKNLLGQTIEVPLNEVFEKQKMTQSLMPNGLGLLLGKEKLVDLVAYLSTLGK